VSEHDWVRFKSLTAFESMQQLALFHKGWTAARDAGEADELLQQTLAGCTFCEAPPGTETGIPTRGVKRSESATRICVYCRIKETPDPNERDHYACDGCGLVVDALAALTRFRVELGHLEGPLQLCARCSPGGPATYWTRDLDEHLVATPLE
jgi:hypothetical protein